MEHVKNDQIIVNSLKRTSLLKSELTRNKMVSQQYLTTCFILVKQLTVQKLKNLVQKTFKPCALSFNLTKLISKFQGSSFLTFV